MVETIPRTLLTCKRCQYRWFSSRKNTELPAICPMCKSPYWRKDKKIHLDHKAKSNLDVELDVLLTTMEKETEEINELDRPTAVDEEIYS